MPVADGPLGAALCGSPWAPRGGWSVSARGYVLKGLPAASFAPPARLAGWGVLTSGPERGRLSREASWGPPGPSLEDLGLFSAPGRRLSPPPASLWPVARPLAPALSGAILAGAARSSSIPFSWWARAGGGGLSLRRELERVTDMFSKSSSSSVRAPSLAPLLPRTMVLGAPGWMEVMHAGSMRGLGRRADSSIRLCHWRGSPVNFCSCWSKPVCTRCSKLDGAEISTRFFFFPNMAPGPEHRTCAGGGWLRLSGSWSQVGWARNTLAWVTSPPGALSYSSAWRRGRSRPGCSARNSGSRTAFSGPAPPPQRPLPPPC